MPDNGSSRKLKMLLAGVLVVVAGCERERELRTGSDTIAPGSTPTIPASSVPSPSAGSTPAPVTSATETSGAVTLVPPTVVPVTTPSSTAEPPAQDPFTGLAALLGGEPLQFGEIAEVEGLRVYEAFTDAADSVRCVVIRREGARSWFRCLYANVPVGFVIVDGGDPWWVEVGANAGEITMTKQPPTWTIVSNGCTDPIVQIASATTSASGAFSGIVCSGASALLSYAASIAEREPIEGGKLLAVNGAEGWNEGGGGSSMPCPYVVDSIDRCLELEATTDLTEVSLPIPPPALLAPQDLAVDVVNVTAEAQAMTAGATDVDSIAAAILAAVTPADAEVAPTLARHDLGATTLLIVDVPAADDAIRSTTWAVWVGVPTDASPPSIARSYAWTNCGRGISGGLCV